MILNQIIHGDALEVLRTWPDGFINCCVTSPPYWGLRDYGIDGQLGLEQLPEVYVARLVEVFREVRRVLRSDGTLWLNLGDSYAANRAYQVPSTKGGPKHSDSQSAGGRGSVVPGGLKPKDLVGIPWRVAFALQADGWYLRQDIIWNKPNPMPESVTDRCTKAHEYIFLLSKSAKYYYDNEAIMETAAYDGRKDEFYKGSVKYYNGVMPDGQPQTLAQAGHARWNKNDDGERIRNRRSVWTVTTQPYKEAHFATFPPRLIEPCILAGCPMGGVVLDPFMGAGTTAVVARKLGRNYVGVELNPDYLVMAQDRIKRECAQMNLFQGIAK